MISADETGPMGDLTLADTVLGEVLKTILIWMEQPANASATTAQAAYRLRDVWQDDGWDRRLPAVDVESWLDAVGRACQARNALVHAAAHGRCRTCRRVEQYTHHKWGAVDRSPGAVLKLTGTIDHLTTQGREVAKAVAGWLNDRDARRLRQEAGEGRRLIVIRAFDWHECEECSSTGERQMGLDVPGTRREYDPWRDN